jgi:hypothetical protein
MIIFAIVRSKQAQTLTIIILELYMIMKKSKLNFVKAYIANLKNLLHMYFKILYLIKKKLISFAIKVQILLIEFCYFLIKNFPYTDKIK